MSENKRLLKPLPLEDLAGTTEKSIDISKTNLRYLMLFFTCFLSLGSFFIYDSPTSIEQDLSKALSISSFEFNLLFAAYSIPNIILPFFCGYLFDIFGVRSAVLILSIVIALGQAIFSLAINLDSYKTALIGRGILGAGTENLNVAQNILIIQWFETSEISMALGSINSLAIVGTILVYNLGPIILNQFSLDIFVWIGFFTCILSVIFAFFVKSLDSKRNLSCKIENLYKINDSDRFNWKKIKNLKGVYWLLVIYYFLMFPCLYCFTFVSSDYFQQRFKYSSSEAGLIISLNYLIVIIFCPFFGVLADKYGRRGLMLLVSAISVTAFHIIFMLTPSDERPVYPIFYFFLLGLSFSLFLAIFSTCLSFSVEKNNLGTAFGINFCLGNIGLSYAPILCGYFVDNTDSQFGYFWSSVFLAGLGILSIIISIVICSIDDFVKELDFETAC